MKVLAGATVSIGRPGGKTEEAPEVRIIVRTGKRRITVTMSAADFALAVTGMSERPASIDERGAA